MPKYMRLYDIATKKVRFYPMFVVSLGCLQTIMSIHIYTRFSELGSSDTETVVDL